MKYSEAQQGRVFIIRLEDGEIVHEVIEEFAKAHSVSAGFLTIIGGADVGSSLIVGPEKPRETPVRPMAVILDHVHEITGVGTLFPDDQGNPLLHMHMACGRHQNTTTGCVRKGVKVWHIMEAILVELINTSGSRHYNPETGFKLLDL